MLPTSNWRKRRRFEDAVDAVPQESEAVAEVDENLEMIERHQAKRCRCTWPTMEQHQEQSSRSTDVLSHNVDSTLQQNKTLIDNRVNTFTMSNVPPPVPVLVTNGQPVQPLLVTNGQPVQPLLVTSGQPIQPFNQTGFDQVPVHLPNNHQSVMYNQQQQANHLQSSASILPPSATFPHSAGGGITGGIAGCRSNLPSCGTGPPVGSWSVPYSGFVPAMMTQVGSHSVWPGQQHHFIQQQQQPQQMSYHQPFVMNGGAPLYNYYPHLMDQFAGHLTTGQGQFHTTDALFEPHLSFYPVVGTQYNGPLTSWLNPLTRMMMMMMMYNSYSSPRQNDQVYSHSSQAVDHLPSSHHVHGFAPQPPHLPPPPHHLPHPPPSPHPHPPAAASHDGLIHHFMSLYGNHHHYLPHIRRIHGNEVENYEALLNLAELVSSKQPRGLSCHEVDQLITYRYKSDGRSSSPSDQNICVICMCKFEDKQMLRVLSCSHEFHVKCIDKWLKINQTCPICRASALDCAAAAAVRPGKD